MTRLVLMAAACTAGASSAADPAGLRIGMPDTMFRDVPPAMVNAMSKPFRTLFERQTGFTGDVEIFPDAQTIAGKMAEGKLDLGVFHGFEFAQAKARHPVLTPVCVAVPNGRVVEALVVVAKSNKAEKLTDLGTETLAVPKGAKAHCFAYLEKVRKGLPATVSKPVAKANMTAEEVLNAVSDGTLTAAVVDGGSFAAYGRLQPGAVKHLRVLCKSEQFPVSVVAARTGSLTIDGADRVKAGLTRANQTAQGKPLMMLWNLSGFEDVPSDYATQLDTILRAYPTPVATAVAEK